MTTPARVEAAVGLVSALVQTRRADEAGRDALTTAAASLMPDLYADGPVKAAVTLARICEVALVLAAQATGTPVDDLWQAVARIVRQAGDASV